MITIFRNLVRKFVADQTLVVLFDSNKNPTYVPSCQSYRMDKKAIIEMPCMERAWIDDSVAEIEIERLLQKVTVENALYLFAHECGHHLTKNPGYDQALSNCLELPVKDRTQADIALVVKEETEAWVLGFKELENLGHLIPDEIQKMADASIEEYRVGASSIEPVHP